MLSNAVTSENFAFFKVAFLVSTSAYGGGFGLIPSFVTDMFGVHNIGATLGLMLFSWPLGSVLGDPGVAFTGSEVDSINAVFVIVIIGFVLALFVRTNPKDRFAGGYSICGCATIKSKPHANSEAEQTTRKDGEAYLALPDAPTIPTMNDRPTDFAGLPGAQALGPYRIPYDTINFGQEISNGGFGVVCRGTYNNQPVAVKRFLPARRSDPYSIECFVQEIQLTASLEHECLVRFVGVAWEAPSSLCMVSEYMHGGDLRTLLERYARTGYASGLDDNKRRIAVQVAHAMAYLHSLSPPMIHRDLKSRNVLLTAAMDAKVIDFGVSREHHDETMTQNVGTSLWMAPEVPVSKRYDEKADIFSFGVILSELDTHALPYDHARDPTSNRKLPSAMREQLITQGRLKPRFTDKALPAIVGLARDCLEVDPRLRPSAADVVYRINQCQLHDPTLTEQTRSALNRSVLTIETRATTRYSLKTKQDTFRISSASFENPMTEPHDTYDLSCGTRVSTRYQPSSSNRNR